MSRSGGNLLRGPCARTIGGRLSRRDQALTRGLSLRQGAPRTFRPTPGSRPMTLLPLRAPSVVLALLVAGRLQAQQTQQMGGNGNSVVAGCQQSATRQLVSSHPGADSVTYDANPTISARSTARRP